MTPTRTTSPAHRRAAGPRPPLIREWIRSRPVHGGILTIAAGGCLLLLPAGQISVVLLPGLAGTSGFLFGAGLCALGLFLLLQPRSHAFAGVAAVLVAITSLVTTNLGGFGFGLALGVLGGALGFAWAPDDRTEPAPDDRTHPIPLDRPDAPVIR